MFMKKIIVFVLILQSLSFFAQNKVEKPKYVIVINDKVVPNEAVEEYAKKGLLASMDKGVSQEERDLLHSKLGDVIGDKEFIIKVRLRTEEELAEQERIKPKMIEGQKEAISEFKLNVNEKAADFVVQMLTDKTIKLSDLKGKVVVINFWATWCGPCLMEFSEIPEKVLKRFEGKNFVFLPIAIGQKKEVVAKKMAELQKYGVNFNVGYDTEAKIWDLYAQGSIPKNFLIDQNGIIKYISQGYSEESLDKLVLEVEKLLSL